LYVAAKLSTPNAQKAKEHAEKQARLALKPV